MKKKLLTLGLSSTLALSSIMPAFANSISENTDKTYIETAIGFQYPEALESLKTKNLKAMLSGNSTNLEIPLNEFLVSSAYSTTIEGYNVSSEVVQEDGKVASIKFKIEGLKASDGYTLTLEGKNYVKTVVNLNTSEYSKRVNISTSANMLLGDINSDGKVDTSDRKILEDNLNATDSEYDLNNDGKITVSDISIVNGNTISQQNPDIFDTDIVPSKLLQKVDEEALNALNEIVTINGDIKNIFSSEGGTVSFQAKDDSETISIPLEFKTPQEMSSVEVNIPQGAKEEDVEILLIDESGNTIKAEKTSPAMAMFSRTNQAVVTVNLGKRVPVKKVIINVKPAEDGGVVVIEEVKFLKDVINENVVQDTTVKNVVAKAGSEEVSLSWRQVPNVTGYKIYYGTDPNNLNKTATCDVTSATISGLENLKTYYFVVSATSGTWEGNKSTVVSATPQPEKAPLRPDFVKATAGDTTIDVSWKEAENAKTYNLYVKTASDETAKIVASDISSTSYKLTGLQNDVEYTIYVTSKNSIGESGFSEPAQATPKKEVIEAPNLPTKNQIDKSNVTKVELSNNGKDYNPTLYPNGFDPMTLVDGDYETSWVANLWYGQNTFTFTFDEAKDMDYLVWVPRLDKNYRQSFSTYTITVWTEGNENGAGTVVANNKGISNRGENNSYFVFDFPKQENVVKIQIKPIQWNGSPTNMSASEVIFYEYNDIADRVEKLFANSSRTQLKEGITLDEINELKAEVSDAEGFVVNKSILLKELEIAEGLFNKDDSKLGVIKNNVVSIKANDIKSINSWQPLGVVGRYKETVTVYADIPEGEEVYLVPTQFFEQADSLSSSPIKLQNGRNIIGIPKIGSVNTDRGGSLYITYSGNRASEIKLQVIGGYDIPYLELSDLYEITEEEAKERISAFIDELEKYCPKLTGNLTYQNLNQSEISLPNVLLSLPADQILKGIKSGATTSDDKINQTYNSMLAWEEFMSVIYKTYGVDNIERKTDTFETRQNIRYMKMFGSAFMYASGNHIGIGYNSVAPLMNGVPTENSNLDSQDSTNSLFGWGIAHEVGHVMDAFGKAEVTNNIYSLMAQTYDGKQNTLQSRLETSGVYDSVFKKVSVGGEGVPNNVFTHLAMYWQLHLAYDNGDEPFKFYNELHKLYRNGSLNGYSDMDKFAVAASTVAQKDLTEFFERWGVVLSESAKTKMKEFTEEERAIYYLTDQSRRERLNNNEGNKNIQVTANSTINPENPKEVIINITNNNTENVQGYEIVRNGKSIGFTTSNTYTDFIGSANNMAFTYQVVPIDILGNVSPTQDAGQVKISYDNTVDSTLYTIDNSTGIVTFTEPTIVTGIKVTSKGTESVPSNGTFEIYANLASDVAPVALYSEDLVDNSQSNEETNENQQATDTEDQVNNDSSIVEDQVENEEGQANENEQANGEVSTDDETNSEDQTTDNEGSSDSEVVEEEKPSNDATESTPNGYVLAKKGDFSKNSTDKENTYISYFNKSGSEEDKIWAYDVNSLKLTGIDLEKYNVEFISYPGDNVEFMDMGIGRLKEDYRYGDTDEDVIPADTLVIVGKYRGNTAYSNIYVKGKFATGSSLSGENTVEEREVAGYTLMFDTLDEDGTITSSTSEGIFIFVPNIQEEEDLHDHKHEHLSVLPTEIMAEMWITDANGVKQRVSSNTTWITMPTEESLPQIEIK